MEPAFFEKIASLQRRPSGSPSQDLSVALRPEKRPVGDHGSQPNAAGAVGLWEVVSGPETIELYNCQLSTCDMFDIIYIYIYVRCKRMFPHLVRASRFYQSCMPLLVLHINNHLISRSYPGHIQIIKRSQPDDKKIISRSQPDRIWFEVHKNIRCQYIGSRRSVRVWAPG